MTEKIRSYTIAQNQTHFRFRDEEEVSNGDNVNEEKGSVEFRRKVSSARSALRTCCRRSLPDACA